MIYSERIKDDSRFALSLIISIILNLLLFLIPSCNKPFKGQELKYETIKTGLISITDSNTIDLNNLQVTGVWKLLTTEGNTNTINGLKVKDVSGNVHAINKITDVNGVASLNINLVAGKYIITSMYDGYATSNTVLVNRL